MKRARTRLAAIVLGLAGALVFVAGSAAVIIPGDPVPVQPSAAAATEFAAPKQVHDASLGLNGVTPTPTPTNDAPYVAAIRVEPLSDQARCGAPPERLTSSQGGPVPIIYDTDFGPDVDDAGALAILHAMADRGEAEILGVMLSTAADFDGPRAVDVINTYYGRPDIPIGLADPLARSIRSRYTEEIASSFENEAVPNPSATNLYRQLLAEQPNQSVTIVSVGFKSNMDDLLLSGPDEFSPLNGADLVAKKVKLWVAMSGQFPDSTQNPRGAEYNFVTDLRATIIATALWPTPIVFSGYEVGEMILTGGVLQNAAPKDNPLREAYRLYTGGDDRESWDLTAVWYAVRGAGNFFELCSGRIVVNADGSNGWDPDGSDQAYLSMKVEPELIAEALDELMVTPPASRTSQTDSSPGVVAVTDSSLSVR